VTFNFETNGTHPQATQPVYQAKVKPNEAPAKDSQKQHPKEHAKEPVKD
jgi:hypothetical protein